MCIVGLGLEDDGQQLPHPPRYASMQCLKAAAVRGGRFVSCKGGGRFVSCKGGGRFVSCQAGEMED